MYNIEVPSDKMRMFDSFMNKENIVYRMVGRSEDNAVTNIAVRKEEEMTKAKELVQKVVAKAELARNLKKKDDDKP